MREGGGGGGGVGGALETASGTGGHMGVAACWQWYEGPCTRVKTP